MRRNGYVAKSRCVITINRRFFHFETKDRVSPAQDFYTTFQNWARARKVIHRGESRLSSPESHCWPIEAHPKSLEVSMLKAERLALLIDSATCWFSKSRMEYTH